MPTAQPEEWQFWESLSVSRLPISYILDSNKRRSRTQMREFSDSAFVHRMFELFFTMRQGWVIDCLSTKEKDALRAFEARWSALPWKPIEAHPHISEISDEALNTLAPAARRLDALLELRTGETLIPVVYRLFKGWKKLKMPRGPLAQNA